MIKLKLIKIKKINLKNYIYYSGSGFLHKGLDLIIEYFIKNQNGNFTYVHQAMKKNF